MQSHEELAGLAEGYVLSALEPDEREAFVAHLATCPICPRRVGELQTVAGLLPLLAEEREPPPHLKQRVLAAARRERAPAASAPSPVRPRRLWPSIVRLATRPAAIALAVGLLAVSTVSLGFWTTRLQGDLSIQEVRLSRAYQAIAIMSEADRWWHGAGTETAPQAAGTLAFSSQRSAACLVVWSLPPTEGGVYHAWTVRKGTYAKVGSLWRMESALWIIIPGDVPALEAVAVTLETTTSLAQPQGPVVLRVPMAAQR